MNLNEIVMQIKSCIFNELYYAHKLFYKVPIKFPEFVFCMFPVQVRPYKKCHYNLRRRHDVQE